MYFLPEVLFKKIKTALHIAFSWIVKKKKKKRIPHCNFQTCYRKQTCFFFWPNLAKNGNFLPVKNASYLSKWRAWRVLAKALDENIVATSSKYLHITATVICNIFDMIKGNESDVGNIGFELQAKRGDKFLCFTLFFKLKNRSYLRNQISDWDGIWIKI